MWGPPNQLVSQGNQIDTSGVIGTTVTTAIVGAPGVGIQLRIWAWKVAAEYTLTGNVMGAVVDSASSNTSGYFGLSAQTRNDRHELPGGLLLPANRGISVIHRASVASQRLFFAVFYTIE